MAMSQTPSLGAEGGLAMQDYKPPTEYFTSTRCLRPRLISVHWICMPCTFSCHLK